ncbi:hypothetical protein BDP27DRAFT_1317924 [Rhodocollybia butyracea]|uniref:Uncharacterized protein n=1 Tax=Rhodocollybia butyracea TaxID=206335 RepID=A0A9P5UBF4_9AGAR|nr:hypothetical protein BDP27DRAFT_1317924 [Rhodocollybia butyracea]
MLKMISISYSKLTWISVLICTSLFASIAQVNSTPLPAGGPSDPTAKLATDLAKVSLNPSLKLKVVNFNTAYEYVSLVVGDFVIGGVFNPESEVYGLKGNLIRNEADESTGKIQLIPFDEKPTFSHPNGYEADLQKLVREVTIPNRAAGQWGGNCVDYVHKVLEEMVKDHMLKEIPKEFTDWSKKNYMRIFKNTLGGVYK